MYKLLINSVSPYVDGSLIPKILGKVGAYYWDETMQTEVSIETEEGISTQPYYGINLVNVEMAFETSEIMRILQEQGTLLYFILEEASKNQTMNIENLIKIKESIFLEQSAIAISQDAIQQINSAGITYPYVIEMEA